MQEALKHKITSFLQSPYGELVGLPATDKEIYEAELALGCTFSRDYVDFIKQFGGAYLGVNIYAFNNHPMMPKDTVTDITNTYRASFKDRASHKLVSQSIVIAIDGVGNPILITPDHQVVMIDHDSDEIEVLVTTFNEFIHKVIDREISDLF